MRLWEGLIVSESLIKAETAVSRKESTWSKAKEDDNKIKIRTE